MGVGTVGDKVLHGEFYIEYPPRLCREANHDMGC